MDSSLSLSYSVNIRISSSKLGSEVGALGVDQLFRIFALLKILLSTEALNGDQSVHMGVITGDPSSSYVVR